MDSTRPLVLLFDLDGTLMTTDGAGRRAIEAAFAVRHGRGDACRNVPFAGMTDRAIARRGLEAIGVAPDEAAITGLLATYLGLLDRELAAARSVRVFPGIEPALSAAARHGAALGLGTGNLRQGAQKKLELTRLWSSFAFGGFADDSESRPELIRIGATRGAERLGVALAECRVVVIGDTPLDVAAAQANGFRSLAVATGVVTVDALRATGADHVAADLSAPGALDFLLGGE